LWKYVLLKVVRMPNYLSKNSFRSTASWLDGGAFSVEPIDLRSGTAVFKVSGIGANEVFANESGGHRFQRTPPTEKKGRVQTSTITVAVLPNIEESKLVIPESDLEWTTTTSRGNGGQSVNTTYSCVVLKHRPSGLSVRCQNERSQLQNKRIALEILRAKLLEKKQQEEQSYRAQRRKVQIGSGQRGDKRRTIRVQDGQVKDHVTGRTWRYDDYLQGKW
jgi:peptide chain release factor 1